MTTFAPAPAHSAPPQPPPPRPRTPLTLTAVAPLPALFSAAAVLATASAMNPLLDGMAWLRPAMIVAALIWLTGVACRSLRAPSYLTALLQFGALVGSLTALFTTSGIAQIIPGPAAIEEGVDLFQAALGQIMTTPPPMPVSEAVQFFLTVVLGALVWAGDLFVAGSKTPALLAIPLLALYSVPAAIWPEMLPWYSFVIPAIAFALVLGTSSWGDGRGSRRPFRTAGIISTALAIVAALVVAALPIGVGTEGRIPIAGETSTTTVSLNPWTTLRGDLTDDQPVDALTVRGLNKPAYLRTFALDKWVPGVGFTFGDLSADIDDIGGALPGVAQPDRSVGVATITPLRYRDNYLPIFLDTHSVENISSGWSYDTDMRTVFRQAKVTPASYRVTASVAPVEGVRLEQDTVSDSRKLLDTGEDLPQQVVDLAESLTADAASPFEAAEAILHYFTDPANGFTYSLATPPGESDDDLLSFLAHKEGYCEQYATTMAIMLRAIGIPARVGVGFTQGERQPNGSYRITSSNAHAWVEVLFDDAGWVMMDPTPPVDGQGGLQGFEVPQEAPNTATSTTPTPSSTAASSSATTSAAPTTSPTTSTGASTTTLLPPPQRAGAGGAPWWLSPLTAGLIGAAVLLLLGFFVAPSLLRQLRRKRRLAVAAAGGPGAAQAAWMEIQDTLRDHDVEIAAGDSARHIIDRVAALTEMPAAHHEQLRHIVSVAEQQWYSDELRPIRTSLADGPRLVRTAMEHVAPLKLARRLWPRSLRRAPFPQAGRA